MTAVCADRRTKPRTLEWLRRVCPGCDVTFECPPYEPTIYCSRECRYHTGAWTKADNVECQTCGANFIAPLKRGRLRKYCSPKCAGAAKLKAVEATCVNCCATFLKTSPRHRGACSRKCRDEYYTLSRAYPWNGGVYYARGVKRIKIDRPGYAAKYEAEYRLTAGRAIGRPLGRGEVVLHIDHDRTNDDPDNLFICGSQSEHQRRRQGSLPWPTHSNLLTYEREGYCAEQAGLAV